MTEIRFMKHTHTVPLNILKTTHPGSTFEPVGEKRAKEINNSSSVKKMRDNSSAFISDIAKFPIYRCDAKDMCSQLNVFQDVKAGDLIEMQPKKQKVE